MANPDKLKLVKEIGRLGGDISGFVSASVAERLKARFAEERRRRGEAKKRVQTFEE